MYIFINLLHELKLRTELCGFSPQANYTNLATAACQQS
jgi:hypothetical protein